MVERQQTLLKDNPDLAFFSVVDDSHFEHTLLAKQQKYPDFQFHVDSNSDVNDLLKKVSQGELLFTMADSVEVSLSQRIYPELAAAFELTEDQPISWFIRRSDDESLYALMIEFLVISSNRAIWRLWKKNTSVILVPLIMSIPALLFARWIHDYLDGRLSFKSTRQSLIGV